MLIVGSTAGLAKCRHIAFCNCDSGLPIFHTMEYSEIFLCLSKREDCMAGSYGAETTQGERYRLSFTVGGLLASQGRALAEMYLNRMGGGSTERSSQTKVSEKDNEKSDKNAGEEVGESIAVIRQQAIEENVLAIRTDSANRRVVAETTRRLSALTVGELAYITQSSGNSPAKYLKSIILPAIRIWTLRIMIGSLRTKPHGIPNWKP